MTGMEKRRAIKDEKIRMVKGRPEKIIMLDEDDEDLDIPAGPEHVTADVCSNGSSALDTGSSPIPSLSRNSEEERIFCPTPLNVRFPIPVEDSYHAPIPSKNKLNVKKFVADLLEQNPGTDQFPCPDPEILVDNNLTQLRDATFVISSLVPKRTNDTTLGINNPMKRICDDNSLVVLVDGYKVKKELAPVLKSIFLKYGDISKKSSFPIETRSCFLEIACGVYKKLEGSEFMDLTRVKIQSMLKQVRDLELVNVEVGWLRDRLDEISKAKQLYENVFVMKEAKKKSLELIEEKKKAVEESEKVLEACLANMKEVMERQNQEKEELAKAISEGDGINEKILAARDLLNRFKQGSLVDGLV